jgi:aminopeptidase N
MRRLILSFVVVLAVVLAVGPIPGVTANRAYTPGARGVGDPYYPNYGNGGYDVQHYDLAIRYKPATDYLWGVATIDAVATQGLSSFNLDLVGLTVRSITVDGAAADWSRTRHELTVVPPNPIDSGSSFTTLVRYDGVPITAFDPFAPGLQIGFMHTDDGAIVSGEPDVAVFWYPANDHPIDRATYTFEVTVPDRYEVVANGLPTGTGSDGRWTTHVWQATDPMAAYLATIDIGDWVIDDYVTERGLRVIDAVDPQHHRAAQSVLAREEEILAFLEDTYGTYPFESAGAIVDDHPGYQFAMEMQTRPVYPTSYFKWGSKNDRAWITSLVLHELAHMWFGDLVAVNQWKDIWLNEGPTTYAEWLWAEHEGQATAQEILENTWADIPADSPFWQIVIGDPGAPNMFHGAVYVRGAMTMQALRNEVGDEDFWRILERWLEEHALATGSTEEFMALAEQVSGEDLDAFFQTWLFTPEKPPESAVLPATAPGLGAGPASVSPGAARWSEAWLEFVEMRARGGS